FGDHMNLEAAFPTFYRYDENRIFTGWLKYVDPSGILVPMQGYAVNFGNVPDPVTVDISGQVNNNNMIPVTAFNSNRPFTQGYNLIGNPYPSPVDWDSQVGWVRENIDDALYFFNAGTTNEYTGTYSTYINGISSDGIADNIITSMQGFFMHVSDGSYPVAATLIFTNDVRVNNLSPLFHKDVKAEIRPLLRISARLGMEGSKGDPLVIYFDEKATSFFEPKRDALKLMNTDILEPNLWAVSQDSEKLSICGLPMMFDSAVVVPLGIKINQTGTVIFKCLDINRMPLNMFVYFCDGKTGIKQNLLLHPEYVANFEDGDHENRFYLIISKYDLRYQPARDKVFHVYSFLNRLFIYMNVPAGEMADLYIHNMLGQPVLHQQLLENGYQEMDLKVNTGIYIVTLRSANEVYTKKVYISNQW
ncbi:MAG: T9SS type A sorting domain-containing protein, partial [Bacteroidetes bacterium]|nr:T9SS type A sorting domain-containing protein [Bacteroidota bacterium]